MSLGASAVNLTEQDTALEYDDYDPETYEAYESQLHEAEQEPSEGRDDGALQALQDEIEVLATGLEAAA